MAIRLKIVGKNPYETRPDEAVFDESGGSLGRAQNNLWILSDPSKVLSGVHGRIFWDAGTYYLEDVSRNGIFTEGGLEPIRMTGPVALRDGATFQIGEYCIAVEFCADSNNSVDSNVALTQEHETVLSTDSSKDIPFPNNGEKCPGIDILQLIDDDDENDDDVLCLSHQDVVDASRLLPQEQHHPTFNAISRVSETMSYPPKAPSVKAPSVKVTYEKSLQSTVKLPRPESPPQREVECAAIFPDNWSSTLHKTSHHDDPPYHHEPSLENVNRHVENVHPASVQQVVPSVETDSTACLPETDAELRPESHELDQRQQDDAFQRFLAAAGMSHFSLNDDVPEQLGAVLKVVTEGLIEALRARGDVREQFRIARTVVKKRDNNPLKFSTGAEDALENFFLKSGKAYLSVVESYKQAFVDLSQHELAVIHGMRTAFKVMLDEFSPECLMAKMDVPEQTRLQKMLGQTPYWESYERYYETLIDNVEKSFKLLFGVPFTDAYEEEVLP